MKNFLLNFRNTFLFYAAIAVISYLICTFIAFDFNVSEWSAFVRLIYVSLILFGVNKGLSK
jgi:hypothetical protein